MAGMVLGAVLVLVGAFVMYRGVRDLRHVRKLRRDGRPVVGTVTGYEKRAGGARAVVVAWTDEHGAAHQHISPMSSSRPNIEVGEAVTMRYLAGDPGSAWLDERRENVRNVLLTLIIGLGFGAAGVALAVKDD
jgi:hypothetical protein